MNIMAMMKTASDRCAQTGGMETKTTDPRTAPGIAPARELKTTRHAIASWPSAARAALLIWPAMVKGGWLRAGQRYPRIGRTRREPPKPAMLERVDAGRAIPSSGRYEMISIERSRSIPSGCSGSVGREVQCNGNTMESANAAVGVERVVDEVSGHRHPQAARETGKARRSA